MRSLMLTLLAATVVAFTVPSAVAQSDIDMGGELSGTLAFVAQGGGNFTLGLCDSLNGQKKCVGGDTLIGKATGDGAFNGDNGFYTLTGNALTTGTFTGCAGTTCNWTLNTASPLNFKMTQGKFGGGIDYLNGTLKMIGLTEVPNGKLFSETITVDLTVTGGTLASLFADQHGNVIFSVQSETTKSLAVSPAGRGIQGILQSGDMSQAPEPGTLALLGSGFLLVGGFLRRKFTA
jgi:PEP-CTERM motif